MAAIRESKLERAASDWAEADGWLQFKFVSPGTTGVPDRLYIKNGVVVFGEWKRPGEEPTEQQYKRMKEMKKHGAIVFWWDNLNDFRRDLRQAVSAR